ncbi:MAG TPA: long-chain fatty acid--CoA ligase [Nitrospiraceae bacterium]|jgi:long-chain acyl-CoA synthetase|nr:long-chain fatty acid--CoA ligase [Nitrospiraceae bacterium]
MLQPWFRHYDPGVPPFCRYPDWTVGDLPQRSATRFPEHPALIFYGRRVSFRQFDELSTRFARALIALAVRPGDRVALMLPNIPQSLIAYYGALKAGAIVVPINPLYVSREIEAQLADSGSETLVVLDQFFPRLEEVRRHTGLPLRTIVTSVRDFLPPGLRLLYPFKAMLTRRWIRIDARPPVYEFLALLAGTSASGRVALPQPRPDDLAQLQYTGGTTGTPKGVMLTHRHLITNAFQCRCWVPDFREGGEIFLGVVPFFHAYGLSTCQNLAVMTGCSIVLLPRFQVLDVLRAIQRYRVTVFSGIPMMFSKMSEFPEARRYDFRSLRVCLSGGSGLPADVQERFERLTGVRISEGYGLTEAGPVTHCNPIYGEHPRGSMGLPFPDTDARVVDLETGRRDMPIGEVGELMVRGPQVMEGYWNNEAETKAVLSDGWLRTGDIAKRDDRGFFFVVDRKKDLIISRGENVYPREVEEVLLKHPAVGDAVVIGIPHPQYGEAVKAYVVARSGRSATAQELIEHCSRSLARFKVPAAIEFRAELPRTVVGKVLRRMLRDEHLRASEATAQRKVG